MFILDEDTDKKIDCVTLVLKKIEVEQLLGCSKQLLDRDSLTDHFHLSSDDYQKEITICMYDSKSMDSLHPRIKKLILNNE